MSGRQGYLPAVRVTDADRREYASIVDESLRETLALYEDFAVRRCRRMDPRRWKLLRAKDGARVYRERSSSDATVSAASRSRSSDASSSNANPFRGVPSSSASSSSSSSLSSSAAAAATGTPTGEPNDSDEPETLAGEDEPVPTSSSAVEIGPGSSLSVSTNVPVLVTTRRVPGELDDVMYGLFATDARGILRRGLYEKDGIGEAVVLATLEAPSAAAPFRSLQVVWMLRAFAGVVGASLVRQRDFVLLLSSGTAVSPATGERVGFGVAQSVAHPDLPELRELQVVRGVLSYCAIFRQLPGREVEAFLQVVIDPRGAALSYFIVQETVTSLLGLSSPIDTALRKKLSWFVRRARARRCRRRDASPSSSSSSSSSPPPSRTDGASPSAGDACVHCAKPLGALLGPQGQRCSICFHWACSKCRVSKSLAVRASGESKGGAPFTAVPFAFCLPCFVAAKSYPARQLQLEELRLRQDASEASGSAGSADGGADDAGATLYRLTEEQEQA